MAEMSPWIVWPTFCSSDMRLISPEMRASVAASVIAAGLCAEGQSAGWAVATGSARMVAESAARASATTLPIERTGRERVIRLGLSKQCEVSGISAGRAVRRAPQE